MLYAKQKMFDKLKGTISQFLPIIIASLILFGIGIVLADKDNWNKPECDPPNCNVPQPINVGGEWQAKDAPIGFNPFKSGIKSPSENTRWIGNSGGTLYISAGETEWKAINNRQLSIRKDGLIKLEGEEGSRRITGVEDPINDDDVATKGWVLAQLGGGGGSIPVVRFTKAYYRGDLGGVAGADAKCQAEFGPSFHFCDCEKALGAMPGVSNVVGWCHDPKSNCSGWTTNRRDVKGEALDGTNRMWMKAADWWVDTECNLPYRLTCCNW